jgi:hypothetical protein
VYEMLEEKRKGVGGVGEVVDSGELMVQGQ